MKQMTRVAVGLGSNKGDRHHFLSAAYRRLKEDLLADPKVSDVFETDPWGGVASGAFLNAVAVGETDWKPPAIVSYLKQLERELGRTQSERYGDREIDLDLLIHDQTVFASDGIEVPHPGLVERVFVLVPLEQVWPDWVHPVSGKTVRQLLEELGPNSLRGSEPIAD